MDRWVDGGSMDQWMDRQMDGWRDEWMRELKERYLFNYSACPGNGKED